MRGQKRTLYPRKSQSMIVQRRQPSSLCLEINHSGRARFTSKEAIVDRRQLDHVLKVSPDLLGLFPSLISQRSEMRFVGHQLDGSRLGSFVK